MLLKVLASKGVKKMLKKAKLAVDYKAVLGDICGTKPLGNLKTAYLTEA